MAFASQIPPVSTPTEGTFRNYPVLTLPNPSDVTKPGVQLGVAKIRAILSNLEACRAFVEKHTKPAKPGKADAMIAALKAAGVADAAIAAAVAAMA